MSDKSNAVLGGRLDSANNELETREPMDTVVPRALEVEYVLEDAAGS